MVNEMMWFKRNPRRHPTIEHLEERRLQAVEAVQSSNEIADQMEPLLRYLEARKPKNHIYELVLDSISAPREART